MNYLDQWDTLLRVDGENQGSKTRTGFMATTPIDRNDFSVIWNGDMENCGGVGNKVLITINIEALQ